MRTVFVIDDHKLVADTITIMLRSEGYNAHAFYSPLEAIAAGRDLIPNAVITDFSMPYMNGLAVASYFRNSDPNCKVIVISGDTAAMSALPARHEFPILEKPVPIPTLLELLKPEHVCYRPEK